MKNYKNLLKIFFVLTLVCCKNIITADRLEAILQHLPASFKLRTDVFKNALTIIEARERIIASLNADKNISYADLKQKLEHALAIMKERERIVASLNADKNISDTDLKQKLQSRLGLVTGYYPKKPFSTKQPKKLRFPYTIEEEEEKPELKTKITSESALKSMTIADKEILYEYILNQLTIPEERQKLIASFKVDADISDADLKQKLIIKLGLARPDTKLFSQTKSQICPKL
jgi:hypothetical protein